MPEGFGSRDALQAEGFDLTAAKHQVARWVPLLTWQHFYFDRVEAVEVDPAFFHGSQANLDDHATIGERVSPLDAGEQGEGEEAHRKGDQGERH